MAKAGSIYLISEERKAHGVHEGTEKTRRKVLCTIRKVRQSEYYQAENNGHKPEYQFNLALAEEYHDEGSLIFQEREYSIIRTYETPEGGLEITAERSDVNDAEDE